MNQGSVFDGNFGADDIALLIIGAMFWYIFRQAKGGANQAFNFGRST